MGDKYQQRYNAMMADYNQHLRDEDERMVREAPYRGDLMACAEVIMRDYRDYSMKGHTHYSLQACLEKVLFRRESVSGCMNGAPCYIWATAPLDDPESDEWEEWDVDFGRMPEIVRTEVEGKYRINMVANEANQFYGPVEFFLFGQDREYSHRRGLFNVAGQDIQALMLHNGILPGAQVLKRFTVEWSVDYWGEGDCTVCHDIMCVVNPPTDPLAAWRRNRYGAPDKNGLIWPINKRLQRLADAERCIHYAAG